MAGQRGHLRRERLGRLRARLRRRDQLGHPVRVLLVEPGAEDPGRLLPHHDRHARGLRDRRPGLERGPGERIGHGEGVREHEREQVARVRHRVFLGDGTAHRHPRQVEARQPEPGDERLQVRGHLTAGVGARRLTGPADAAVVVADHAQARPDEIVHLVDPAVQVVADAVDQDQVPRPLPGDPVADIDRVATHEPGGHRIPRSVIAVFQRAAEAVMAVASGTAVAQYAAARPSDRGPESRTLFSGFNRARRFLFF